MPRVNHKSGISQLTWGIIRSLYFTPLQDQHSWPPIYTVSPLNQSSNAYWSINQNETNKLNLFLHTWESTTCIDMILWGFDIGFFLRNAALRDLEEFAPPRSHKRIILRQQVQVLLLILLLGRRPGHFSCSLPTPWPGEEPHIALSYNSLPVPKLTLGIPFWDTGFWREANFNLQQYL